MRVFHLGVVDQIYKSDKTKELVTTGFVAQILEDNYGVMRTFLELHEQEIADDLAASMMDIIDAMSAGVKPPSKLIDFPDIEKMFQRYLALGEWESVSMQPTLASLTRSSRKKEVDDIKNARPSFIDTGQYQNAFKAWIDV